MSFFTRNFHQLLGTTLLALAAGVALALYFDVPASLRAAMAGQVQGHSCSVHGKATATTSGHAAGHQGCVHAEQKADCGHAQPQHTCGATAHPESGQGHAQQKQDHSHQAGCCEDKTQPVAAMTLPPGHPPIAGWTVATNAPAAD